MVYSRHGRLTVWSACGGLCACRLHGPIYVSPDLDVWPVEEVTIRELPPPPLSKYLFSCVDVFCHKQLYKSGYIASGHYSILYSQGSLCPLQQIVQLFRHVEPSFHQRWALVFLVALSLFAPFKYVRYRAIWKQMWSLARNRAFCGQTMTLIYSHWFPTPLPSFG